VAQAHHVQRRHRPGTPCREGPGCGPGRAWKHNSRKGKGEGEALWPLIVIPSAWIDAFDMCVASPPSQIDHNHLDKARRTWACWWSRAWRPGVPHRDGRRRGLVHGVRHPRRGAGLQRGAARGRGDEPEAVPRGEDVRGDGRGEPHRGHPRPGGAGGTATWSRKSSTPRSGPPPPSPSTTPSQFRPLFLRSLASKGSPLQGAQSCFGYGESSAPPSETCLIPTSMVCLGLGAPQGRGDDVRSIVVGDERCRCSRSGARSTRSRTPSSSSPRARPC